jgi:hypothetical protein
MNTQFFRVAVPGVLAGILFLSVLVGLPSELAAAKKSTSKAVAKPARGFRQTSKADESGLAYEQWLKKYGAMTALPPAQPLRRTMAPARPC